ncbi:MAG: hypothetical protein MRK02_08265 [Candidatus Scalindua sp.]|nr:hypothetical protein [Candidatus Scalindua sp.]
MTDNPNDKKHNDNESDKARKQRFLLIFYNVGLSLILSGGLVFLVAFTPSMPVDNGLKDTQDNGTYRFIMVATLVAMFVAGATGGILCNLCNDELIAFLKTNRNNPPMSATDLYFRPLKGALTGLLAFFVGNLFVTSLSIDATQQSWVTLPGRLPYIAVAILAGYAAPEFMYRLKEVAKTLFSAKDMDKGKIEEDNNTSENPPPV